MASPPNPRIPAKNNAPVPDETTLTGLTVEGDLPPALSGQYVRIGPNPTTPSAPARVLDGMVHAVELRAGRAVAYRNRWVITDNVARTLGTEPTSGPPAVASDVVAANVITFGGRTLVLGSGALAYELDEHLATVRRVDLAGHGRGVGAHPQIDPVTGALHLVSYGDEPAHHSVASNGHARVSVPVPDAPGPLHDLLLTRTQLVVFGEGFVGIADRTTEAPFVWVDADPAGAISAHDVGDDAVVLSTDRGLTRWTFRSASARHEVLDDTPQRFGTTNPERASGPNYLWTVAAAHGTEAYRHDLRTGARISHDFGPGRHPGELTFVADPARRHREDGGWLVGFVHHDDGKDADLTVLDAAAINRPPIATVRIPRRIPSGLHGTWIPTA